MRTGKSVKRLLSITGLLMLLGTAYAAQRGIPVTQSNVLEYIRVGIVLEKHRCNSISNAKLWALDTGGTYVQVLCDSTGEGTGFWYGVSFDSDSKVERVKPLNGPIL